jgi:poly(beta-D-mannuronate) lyase
MGRPALQLLGTLRKHICGGFVLIGSSLGVVSFTGPATAADYLVTTQDEFRSRAEALLPGDTIILANGAWNDFEVVLTGEGTKENPITLRAETPGKVALAGRSNLRLAGEFLVVSGLRFENGHSPEDEVIAFRVDDKRLANNSRIYDTAIIGFSNPDRKHEDNWVALYGRNNRFDHNYIAGKTNKGATLVVRLTTPESRENNHLIEENFFGHRPPLGGNGGETMRIGVSQTSRTQSKTVIRRNYFERCDGEVEIISNKSEGNQIIENVFYESRGAVVFRHGGGNTIARNVFFGNGVRDTGGVRVINENQTVRDNYFEGLRGEKFLGALTIMNGVPNSPENRYHQVQNALIERNSFIDVTSVGLAVGADEERSAAPVNSRVSRNLVLSETARPLHIFDDISGIKFSNNLSNNAAFEQIGTKLEREIALTRAANGLLYPVNAKIDAGAPRDLDPVARDDTGPSWFEKPAQVREATGAPVTVSSVKELLKVAEKPGANILLTDGEYRLKALLLIDHALKITGSGDTTLLARASSLFDIRAGGALELSNLTLAADRKNEAVIQASGKIYEGAYTLQIFDVSIKDAAKGKAVAFFKADPETFAEEIVVDGLDAEGWRGPIFSLSGDGLDGWYLADDVSIENSTFSHIGGPALSYGRAGRDESTFGPRAMISGSTFQNAGDAEQDAIDLDGIDGVKIVGNVFNASGRVYIKQRVLGLTFDIDDNAFNEMDGPILLDVAGEPMTAGALK